MSTLPHTQFISPPPPSRSPGCLKTLLPRHPHIDSPALQADAQSMGATWYHFTCGGCGHNFSAPEVSGWIYGTFVMRTDSGEARLLMAIEDPVFAELHEIVKGYPLPDSLDERKRGELHQSVFTVACDTGEQDQPFEIEKPPRCPSCGSHAMAKGSPAVPPTTASLPSVTHNRWNSLTEAGKTHLVHQGITEYLARHP